MYDVLKVWDTFGSEPGAPEVVREFASIWASADKVVYSATLEAVETRRTRLEREFDPAAARSMGDAAGRDVSVGGAELGATAPRAGNGDPVALSPNPVVVRGGAASP